MSDIDVVSTREKENILAFFQHNEGGGRIMIYKRFSIEHLSLILGR